MHTIASVLGAFYFLGMTRNFAAFLVVIPCLKTKKEAISTPLVIAGPLFRRFLRSRHPPLS